MGQTKSTILWGGNDFSNCIAASGSEPKIVTHSELLMTAALSMRSILCGVARIMCIYNVWYSLVKSLVFVLKTSLDAFPSPGRPVLPR